MPLSEARDRRGRPFRLRQEQTRRGSMATTRVYNVAVIPGDGIGKEVVTEGIRVLEAAGKKYGFEIRQAWHDFASCDYYLEHGRMMPEDWKERIGSQDAIFFGAEIGRASCRERV